LDLQRFLHSKHVGDCASFFPDKPADKGLDDVSAL
jgi:hypothetical protein